MKIAMFEGYKRHPRRKKYGSHKRKRRSYRGASAKQIAHRNKFKAAIKSCKMKKGRAKFKCIKAYFRK